MSRWLFSRYMPLPPPRPYVISRDVGAFQLQQRLAAVMSLREHRMGPADVSWPGFFTCSRAELKRSRLSRVEPANASHPRRYGGS